MINIGQAQMVMGGAPSQPNIYQQNVLGKAAMRENSMEDLSGMQGQSLLSIPNNGGLMSQASQRPQVDDNGMPLRVQRTMLNKLQPAGNAGGQSSLNVHDVANQDQLEAELARSQIALSIPEGDQPKKKKKGHTHKTLTEQEE